MAVEAGAIDALVAVLRAHVGGDAGVLESACGTMIWLCIVNGAWSWRLWACSMSWLTMKCRPRLLSLLSLMMLLMLLECECAVGGQARIVCWLLRPAPSMHWWRC